MIQSVGRVLCGAILVGILALPPGVGAAQQKSWQFAVDTPEEFSVAAAALRLEMEPEGRYAEASAADRAAVERDLALMQRLIESRGTAGQLPERQQVELANAQERVNAILTRNDGDRMVCTYERRTGSNFKEKICATARARDHARKDAREGMRDLMLRSPSPAKPADS